jgi:hypothetical protein
LYVNAEHDSNVGIITISRETYNSDVDAELNRAIDWLKADGIDNVIVTGDFLQTPASFSQLWTMCGRDAAWPPLGLRQPGGSTTSSECL